MNGYCQTRRSQSSFCKAVDKRQREAENNQAAIIVLFRWLVEMPSSPTLMAVISVGSGDRCFSRMDRRPSKPAGSVLHCVPSSTDSFRCPSSANKCQGSHQQKKRPKLGFLDKLALPPFPVILNSSTKHFRGVSAPSFSSKVITLSTIYGSLHPISIQSNRDFVWKM